SHGSTKTVLFQIHEGSHDSPATQQHTGACPVSLRVLQGNIQLVGYFRLIYPTGGLDKTKYVVLRVYRRAEKTYISCSSGSRCSAPCLAGCPESRFQSLVARLHLGSQTTSI
ncbi:unnamed protein product, partial [Ectocarpus sp. 8 AP-2014]